MRLFNKVAIVGVGLIGGSIAMALKKRKLCATVAGLSRHRSTINFAKQKGIIDEGSCGLEIVRDADLLIFATPVKTILKLAPRIAEVLNPQCVVTDVGSTKEEVVAKLERIFAHFVGTHPLAGSEKRGASNATTDLFKGTLCILTPTPKTDARARNRVEKMWQCLGAHTISFGVSEHDAILSFISHLPHALAFSLVNTVPPGYLEFAHTGFKDTTRVAGSDSRLWTDIFLSNRRNMIKAIESFGKNLSLLKRAISNNDRVKLNRFLEAAKRKREALN